MGPEQAVDSLLRLLDGEPVYIAGSSVAAVEHGIDGYEDVDVFVPTPQVLMTTGQILIDNGATLDDRFDRVWHRWKRYGFKGFHTNSLRLHTKDDVPVNLVYKIVDGHPTTSLAQVLESFDFGLLGVGYDVETGLFKDMRPYLFPGLDPRGPLPLMPDKRDAWTQGFISTYVGLREGYRYAKYVRYGYDMSLVQPDLVQGYRIASLYHSTKDDRDKQLLSRIYLTLADRIEADETDELVESYRILDFKDSLDEILEALE